MPAVAVILIVFACMLGLTRVRIPLGLAAIAGAIALDLSGGNEPNVILNHLRDAVFAPEFWLLLCTIILIIEFARYMTEDENSNEIMGIATHWGGKHGRTWTVMLGPAILGLFPMPGGALFSAPLVHKAVESSNKDHALPPDVKAGINYWFRHVWEYWWPLYPGVIVAMSFFDMEVWKFIAVQCLFTPFAFIGGYFFLVRPCQNILSSIPTTGETHSRRILLLMVPLLIVLICAISLPQEIKARFPSISSQSRKLIGMLTGLLIGSIVLIVDEKRRGHFRFLKSAFTRKSLNVLFSVLGILIFRALLGNSGLVSDACDEMQAWGFPSVVAVATLPLLAGMVTGIAFGFTGVSFPLVIALMEAEGSGLTPLSTLVLAYGFGLMGMMFSPVHICMLVTRDYFGASLGACFKRIMPCGIVMLIVSVALHLILGYLGL
jgi:integral membrane protein (TIGR00529 family)